MSEKGSILTFILFLLLVYLSVYVVLLHWKEFGVSSWFSSETKLGVWLFAYLGFLGVGFFWFVVFFLFLFSFLVGVGLVCFIKNVIKNKVCLVNCTLPWSSGWREINECNDQLWNQTSVKNSIHAETRQLSILLIQSHKHFESAYYLPKGIKPK